MSFAERMIEWNRWYDDIPETWRFSVVVWTVVAIGAITCSTVRPIK